MHAAQPADPIGDGHESQSSATHIGVWATHARRVSRALLRERRRLIALTLIVLTGLPGLSQAWPQEAQRGFEKHWVGTWAAAQMPAGSTPAQPPGYPEALEDQTVRQIVRISVGGTRIRLRFSNLFGTQPLVIGEARVALHAGGASIVPYSDRKLTFHARRSVTVPVGSSVLSDPVDFLVPSLSDLAVSIYVPEDTGQPSYHDVGMQTAYISSPGNFTSARTLPAIQTSTSRYWLTSVEVASFKNVDAVVAFGGAITDGMGSTLDANHRWPDLLSARLNAHHRHSRLSVINGGLACNRLIRDFCGPSALSRFDRDALDQKGVTHVIVDLGLLDIVLPTFLGLPHEDASAEEIIGALRQLIERAHTERVRIFGATLTPVGNAIVPGFFTPENEAKRQAVNAWIRTSGEFDGVIDFDRILRDPNHAEDLAALYDNGSGIEINDAGHEAIAEAIELKLFRGR
jgi:lysophospholipase L1-like esterase